MTLGQWYNALKGLALGKYHTKLQLSSPKGMKGISCKRNADVKLHLNLQVNLNLCLASPSSPTPSRISGLKLAFSSTTKQLSSVYFVCKILTLQPHQWYQSDIFSHIFVCFLGDLLYILAPSPAHGHDPGAMVYALKGLALGKYHTKFRLSSPKGMKVISCKRNAYVKLHLNLQVNLNPVTNVTYAHTHVTSRRNAICPTPAFCRWRHKNPKLY